MCDFVLLAYIFLVQISHHFYSTDFGFDRLMAQHKIIIKNGKSLENVTFDVITFNVEMRAVVIHV